VAQALLLTRRRAIGVLAACAAGCGRPDRPGLTIAAAANLTDAFDRIGELFTRKTGIRLIYSYGSTAQLAQQIENGAPFDGFAAADTEHIDDLIREGSIVPESRIVYARGRLALWSPRGEVRGIGDLAARAIRFIAIARPEAAPYGRAAVESLRNSGVWDRVAPKLVYANNINAAKHYASSGSADAAFTAYSLVLHEPGRVLVVDESLHRPIDQAAGIVSASTRKAEARRFLSFLTESEGRSTLERFGYQIPTK